MSAVVSAAIEGFALGASLIIAIGAQNAFVLRQGLSGEHVGPVVALCALSDAVLISLGAVGMGSLMNASTGLFGALALAGAAFLAWYAIRAARRAIRPGRLAATGGERLSRRAAIATVAALTWANPHVYIDTVVLLGGVCGRYAMPARAFFAGGAMAASLMWFSALGYGARLLQPLFARPLSWRILDGLIFLVMAALATRLMAEGLRVL